MRPLLFLTTICTAFSLASLQPARAGGVARFDGFTEGIAGTVVLESGVTFSNLDTGLGPPPATFVIEDASATLGATPGFTSPNALGFSGWSPGPGAAFSRCKSFEITTGQVESAVTLDFYLAPGQAGNSITIERWLGATLSASTTHALPSGSPFAVLPISLTGANFDRLRIVGTGPSQSGAFFALLDEVIFSGALPGSSFCSGDGLDAAITTACPCNNFGGAGRGCANSVNSSGAELEATGSTNPDTVVLHASGMPATVATIFLQGDVLDDAVFGDGVRCAGGNLIRLRIRNAVGGDATFPDASDTVQLSVRGGVTPGSGAVRYYQTYYRNAAAAFCPPATFNVTGGWRIAW